MAALRCPYCDRESGLLSWNNAERFCPHCNFRWDKNRKGYSAETPGVRYTHRTPPLWMVMNRHFGLCWCGRPRKGRFPGFCSDDHYTIWKSAAAWWVELRGRLASVDMVCRICRTEPVKHPGFFNCAADNTVLDHIIPIKLGGWCFDEANLQSLCRKCNIRKTKRDLSMIYFSTHDPKTIKGKGDLPPGQTTLDG